MLLLVLFCLIVIFLNHSECGFAPEKDVSSTFPEGWCDRRFGKPTRTTGECICFKNCDGPKCHKQQGFIFYSYTDCPTCRCTALDENMKESPKLSISSKDASVKVTSKSDHDPADQVKSKGLFADDEEEFSWRFFIEENWRYVFAAIISIIVMFVVIFSSVIVYNQEPDISKNETEAAVKLQ